MHFLFLPLYPHLCFLLLHSYPIVVILWLPLLLFPFLVPAYLQFLVSDYPVITFVIGLGLF